MITVVIPAYNERIELPRAVAALAEQTVRPHRVVVVLNNAQPGLDDIAVDTGAVVLDMGRCPGLKAEALNRAFAVLLPVAAEDDRFLVCDADSVLAPTWIETALGYGEDTIVGGIFLGEPGGGWLGRAQRNEYRSYAREIYARNDRAWVLTGTGTMFSAWQARAVLELRGRLYDEEVATEDFELTVVFRSLGYRTVSPQGCEVTTEVMGSLRSLVDQRTRWYRGAVETLRLHGANRTTAPYLFQQTKIVFGLLLGWVAMALLAVLSMSGTLAITPWWLIAAIPVVSRIVAAEHRWFSAAIVPEMFYDLVLQVALVAGWRQAFANTGRVWNAAEGNH